MEFRQTKHQVARGTRPDAESYGKFFLIKRVSILRATYQVRLLVFRAIQEGKKLVIEVPATTKIHKTLLELKEQAPKSIVIERK